MIITAHIFTFNSSGNHKVEFGEGMWLEQLLTQTVNVRMFDHKG